MFWIVCDPSLGSTELCLTEIMMGWELVVPSPLYYAHTHCRFKITLPNTDQAHEKYL